MLTPTLLPMRLYRLGAGDALDVILKYVQYLDEQIGVYVNDPNSFVVIEVVRPIPRTPPKRLAAH